LTAGIWARRRLPKATTVFDAYWRFAAERQRIFRRRLLGVDWTTNDPVLTRFRFTNAYRASDRTTQFLIERVIYDADRSWKDTFVRVILFKLFNRIETWQLLDGTGSRVCEATLDVARLQRTLDHAVAIGERIYSAAYIIPPASSFGAVRKHTNHLRLLKRMLRDSVDARVGAARSLRECYEILISQPSIGRFLGYQFAIDLNYSPHLNFSEDDFVMPGPGALDGLSKCFSDLGDFAPEDVIRWTADTQREQFEARGIAFDDLWGRPLQLVDCQNIYCEISKYARVAHPEFRGVAGRTRIKQQFVPRGDILTAWYPPKWGLNTRIRDWLSATPASAMGPGA
jgi:alpha-glutamyl/putrescinyl thymine pyrophosphorylase clade 1